MEAEAEEEEEESEAEAEAWLVEFMSQGAGQSLDVGAAKIRYKVCYPAQSFTLTI